jgi:DUF1016 N-terminal domain
MGKPTSLAVARALTIHPASVSGYWEVGRRIVEHEQHGKKRAVYGEALIERLALDLTGKFGRGFSQSNLWQIRDFYLAWPILQTASGKSRPSKPTRVDTPKFQTEARCWSALAVSFAGTGKWSSVGSAHGLTRSRRPALTRSMAFK